MFKGRKWRGLHPLLRSMVSTGGTGNGRLLYSEGPSTGSYGAAIRAPLESEAITLIIQEEGKLLNY